MSEKTTSETKISVKDVWNFLTKSWVIISFIGMCIYGVAVNVGEHRAFANDISGIQTEVQKNQEFRERTLESLGRIEGKLGIKGN